MIEVPFEVIKGAKPYTVKPFTSKTEKSILEFGVMMDDEDLIFDNVCRLLEVPDDLSLQLKLAYIYKAREISFGSDLTIRFKCPKCGQIAESVIMLEDLLSWDHLKDVPEYLQDLELKNKDVTYSEIVKLPVTAAWEYFGARKPASLAEAVKYAVALKSKVPVLKESLNAKCFCGYQKPVNLHNKKFCLDSLSEHTASTMLQTYNTLVFNGFTKLDVDSMFPFEREIHMGLFKEKTEKFLKPNQ